MKSNLQAVTEILKSKKSFLIGGHVSPDGDSLGCMCALGIALERMEKKVVLLSADGVPELYSFLPISNKVIKTAPVRSCFEVGIVIDCEDISRLGQVEEAFRSCETIIEIDHHPNLDRNGNLQLIWPSAAAAGEIVFELLKNMEVRIDADIATCLLTAIMTDTGSFRFSNVTPQTFRISAELLEKGASPSKIAHNVYENRSLSSTKLLGAVLSSLQTTDSGRIAWASITQEQLATIQASEAETEGVVNYIRSIRGAQVGVLFRECPDGSTRVSLRSRDGSDISQVARLFGGGGHRTAAGCTINHPLAHTQELVIDAVRKWMGS
ncbi:MAG: bifunctional oligoribonuclease/PAP phosphatase NrnA [Armatimonadota bacterium]|nr:bifunctional oligoribonuclease/PAP phosphatase NrnA [Armatimonadota bacterium]